MEISQEILEENDFICKICLDFIVSAVTTKCGHSFCEICLFDYLMYFSKCPACPLILRHCNDFGASKMMDNLIENLLISYQDSELLEKYNRRITENKSWNQKRVVKGVRVGMRIDIQTKEFVWKVACIKRLVVRAENFIFLAVTYEVNFF